MPAKSEKQRRFMAMCAHTPGKAYKKCPSKKVAREFSFKRKRLTMPRKDKRGFY